MSTPDYQLVYESPDGIKAFVDMNAPPALRKYTLRGVIPANLSATRIDEFLEHAEEILQHNSSVQPS